MIDLKTVAKMAKQHSEDAEWVRRVYKDGPGEYGEFAADCLEMTGNLIDDLARSAAKYDDSQGATTIQ